MQYDEALTEMVFPRERVTRALESYDTRIFEHATKIILIPQGQDTGHWKREFASVGWLSRVTPIEGQ